nr:zinc finger protein 414 isoform X3 [Saimiri boliviensis boliviensis]
MEEKPSGPSPDMPATAEPSSSETDKEVLSPAGPAAATSSMAEEPGPEQATTPLVWERGGPGGTQQGSSPAPDSCQPGPGPSPGLTSIVSGTSEDLRPPRRRPPSGKHIPCSSPGCCLSFPSIRDLAQHLRTHCPPTQSLEGKLFRCSALSCTETFPSMQELVTHSKLHYKPNRYFKCWQQPSKTPGRLRRALRARGPEPHRVGAHARPLLVHAVRLLHGLAARHDPAPGGPPPRHPRGPRARAATPRRPGGSRPCYFPVCHHLSRETQSQQAPWSRDLSSTPSPTEMGRPFLCEQWVHGHHAALWDKLTLSQGLGNWVTT